MSDQCGVCGGLELEKDTHFVVCDECWEDHDKRPARASQPVAVAPEPSRNYDEVTCVWSVTKNKSFRCILDAGHNGLHHVVFGDAEHLGEPGVAETAERPSAGELYSALKWLQALADTAPTLTVPQYVATILAALAAPAPAQPEFRPADEFFAELRAAQPAGEAALVLEGLREVAHALESPDGTRPPFVAPLGVVRANVAYAIAWIEAHQSPPMTATLDVAEAAVKVLGKAMQDACQDFTEETWDSGVELFRSHAIAFLEAHAGPAPRRCPIVGCTLPEPHEHNSGGPEGAAREDTP